MTNVTRVRPRGPIRRGQQQEAPRGAQASVWTAPRERPFAQITFLGPGLSLHARP